MEEWKNKIMNSLKGMDKAQPPANTFLNIKAEIARQKTDEKNLSYRQWIAAAVILLMICANVFAITNYYGEENTTSSQMESSELITNLNLYQP